MKKVSNKYKHGFLLTAGTIVARRFHIIERLGSGTEGEVYKVRELRTNNYRAIKLFYPEKNIDFKVSTRYAKKLDKLRDSPIVMDYFSYEVIKINDEKVACLTSELIEGQKLHDFVKGQKFNRLGIFPSIHLIYSIVRGVESIHLHGEYHGDLHVDNVIIRRFGLEFDLKIIDFHHWGDSRQSNREEDIVKIIHIFYEILGGRARYSKLSQSIKYIICGLKRSLILQRFKTISDLRNHLECMDWSDAV